MSGIYTYSSGRVPLQRHCIYGALRPASTRRGGLQRRACASNIVCWRGFHLMSIGWCRRRGSGVLRRDAKRARYSPPTFSCPPRPLHVPVYRAFVVRGGARHRGAQPRPRTRCAASVLATLSFVCVRADDRDLGRPGRMASSIRAGAPHRLDRRQSFAPSCSQQDRERSEGHHRRRHRPLSRPFLAHGAELTLSLALITKYRRLRHPHARSAGSHAPRLVGMARRRPRRLRGGAAGSDDHRAPPQTGLPNRRCFQSLLAERIRTSTRARQARAGSD